MREYLFLFLLACLPIPVLGQGISPHSDIEELLVVMRLPQMLDDKVAELKTAITNSAKRPGMSAQAAERKRILLQKISVLFESELSWEKMKPEYSRLYSEIYTPREVKELLLFFKSPTGHTYLDNQSVAVKKATAIGEQKMTIIQPKVRELLKQEADFQLNSLPPPL